MLKLVLPFSFSIYYFSLFFKQTAGQPTVVRSNHTHRRVVHGRNIENGKYPFAVILFTFDKICKNDTCRICTASMITERWVITAAHCANSLRDSKSYVWYGNYTVPPSESKLFTLVLEIFVHPGHRSLNLNLLNAFVEDNDISLLRVRPISLRRYGRLSSVDYTTLIGLPVTYVGAGTTDRPGDDHMRLLQLGEGTVVSCDREFRDMTRYLICIAPKCSNRRSSPESGDSGGPLLYDGHIIGVLSFGEDSHGVLNDGYTPVSPYLDWIYEVTRRNNNV